MKPQPAFHPVSIKVPAIWVVRVRSSSIDIDLQCLSQVYKRRALVSSFILLFLTLNLRLARHKMESKLSCFTVICTYLSKTNIINIYTYNCGQQCIKKNSGISKPFILLCCGAGNLQRAQAWQCVRAGLRCKPGFYLYALLEQRNFHIVIVVQPFGYIPLLVYRLQRSVCFVAPVLEDTEEPYRTNDSFKVRCMLLISLLKICFILGDSHKHCKEKPSHCFLNWQLPKTSKAQKSITPKDLQELILDGKAIKRYPFVLCVK